MMVRPRASPPSFAGGQAGWPLAPPLRIKHDEPGAPHRIRSDPSPLRSRGPTRSRRPYPPRDRAEPYRTCPVACGACMHAPSSRAGRLSGPGRHDTIVPDRSARPAGACTARRVGTAGLNGSELSRTYGEGPYRRSEGEKGPQEEREQSCRNFPETAGQRTFANLLSSRFRGKQRRSGASKGPNAYVRAAGLVTHGASCCSALLC